MDEFEDELLVLSNSLSQEEVRAGEGLLLRRASIPGPLLEKPKLPWSSKGLSRYLCVDIGEFMLLLRFIVLLCIYKVDDKIAHPLDQVGALICLKSCYIWVTPGGT